MKLADVTTGQDYVYEPAVGRMRRVTVMAFEKVAQTDRYTGRPNGRHVMQAKVCPTDEDRVFHVEARYLTRPWEEQEAINADNERRAVERRRLDEIGTRLIACLQANGVNVRRRGISSMIEIPPFEFENLERFLNEVLDARDQLSA